MIEIYCNYDILSFTLIFIFANIILKIRMSSLLNSLDDLVQIINILLVALFWVAKLNH